MSKIIHILMVEDSPTDAELAREAFLESKIANKLTVVEDGVKALEYLHSTCTANSENCPDLILLDLNLPKKDGLQVLAEIKGNVLIKHIPVVILTTSNAETDVIKSYQLQASCYITKPVDFEKFAAIVQKVQQFYFQIVTLAPSGPHDGSASGEQPK